MEDYQQDDYTEHGDRIGFGTDRTYDNELANETMETRLMIFQVNLIITAKKMLNRWRITSRMIIRNMAIESVLERIERTIMN